MKTIQEAILDEFCERLAHSEAFMHVDVPRLRKLLSGGAKPKPDDLARVLSEPSEPPSAMT